MKLVGYGFAGASIPLGRGYLPLSSLTAVIGGNDAGKTSLLNRFSRALSGAGSGSEGFYISCSRPEFSLLTEHALEDLISPADDPMPSGQDPRGSVRGWFEGHIEGASLDETGIDPDLPPVDAWAETIRDAAQPQGCSVLGPNPAV